MSRLDPLIESLRKSDAQEMRLEVGQRIYLLRGGQRTEVGRDSLVASSIESLAAEALPPHQLGLLAQAPQSVRLNRQGDDFDVLFGRLNGHLAIAIRRAVPAAASPEAPATAPPPAAAPRPPAPASAPPGAGKRIDELLRFMIGENASDLHLSSDCHPVIRVHGEVHFLTNRPVMRSEEIEALVREIMTEKARREFDEKHDADFAYELRGSARFRVNVFSDRKGTGTVLRQIPIEIVTAEKLGLSKAVLDLCFLPKGLVVVTGPTGSGKSTTLAGMVDFINKSRTDHIVTIEEPVEFVHPNIKCLVNQREVGIHTMSFKNALRAALREDPDIVLVGEMRDLETIAIAIETAETGHLVFGTLHTSSAVSTVDRIIDQFPADRQAQVRVMLSESLKGVIAQVLCKRIGGGRVAAMEVLLGTAPVANLIREGKTFQIPSIMQTSKRQGMLTMNDALFTLVKEKQVEAKDAWMKAADKGGLISLFRGASIPTDFAGSEDAKSPAPPAAATGPGSTSSSGASRRP